MARINPSRFALAHLCFVTQALEHAPSLGPLAPPLVAFPLPNADGTIHGMRVNLITKPLGPCSANARMVPLSLTIRPACGLPGDYSVPTDSDALLRLLRRSTDLSSTVLKRFEDELHRLPSARLLGVDLSDNALTDIGYFID